LSHLVSIKKKVRDLAAVQAACSRLKLPPAVEGTAKLYGVQATGLLLMLPEWRYPVVLDLAQGEVKFDNFEGAWGEIKHLNAFFQAYQVEKAKLEARRKGLSVSEQLLADGTVRVNITSNASAAAELR
jgi:hypothetical protein